MKTWNPVRSQIEHGGIGCALEDETKRFAPNTEPLEFPESRVTKIVACGKCGREMTVGKNVVIAYCRECSSAMGVKK